MSDEKIMTLGCTVVALGLLSLMAYGCDRQNTYNAGALQSTREKMEVCVRARGTWLDPNCIAPQEGAR